MVLISGKKKKETARILQNSDTQRGKGRCTTLQKTTFTALKNDFMTLTPHTKV